jgi:NAD(P)H dehydrogenase (quinone)
MLMMQLLRVLILCLAANLFPVMHGQSADDPQAIINVLIGYHSLSGHTEQMAKAVAEGTRSISQARVTIKRVKEVTAEELFAADAIILGSPVYWSNMAGEVKSFIDDWQFKFGVFPEFKLKNKVGAAFATGGQISSGKELTMLSMLAAMLGNHMIVVSGGGAFGASATTESSSPGIDDQELSGARDLGRRVAEVTIAVKRGFESEEKLPVTKAK